MMDDRADYRPGEVAAILGIAASTLRTYAFQFRGILSPDAAADPPSSGHGFRHRRYTEADLVILKRATELLADGLNYRAVLQRLGRPDSGPLAQPRGRPRSPRRSRSGAADPSVRPSPPPLAEPPIDAPSVDGPKIAPVAAESNESHDLPINEVMDALTRAAEFDAARFNVLIARFDRLAIRLDRLAEAVNGQSESFQQLERSLADDLLSIREARAQQVAPLPPPVATSEPRTRNWLQRLFGG
jgi:DNA-binding transcriptional MerR regulator